MPNHGFSPTKLRYNDMVERYHRALLPRVRAWLRRRLIADDVIARAKLGWTGTALAIPIFNHQGQFAFFKFRKDPDDNHSSRPKYWVQPGAWAALYGGQKLDTLQTVVICEGE